MRSSPAAASEPQTILLQGARIGAAEPSLKRPSNRLRLRECPLPFRPARELSEELRPVRLRQTIELLQDHLAASAEPRNLDHIAPLAFPDLGLPLFLQPALPGPGGRNGMIPERPAYGAVPLCVPCSRKRAAPWVELLENARRMGGGGEAGTPPSMPALGNAILALTGKRLRALPFSREVDFA